MGDTIRASPLIIIGDIGTSGPSPFEQVVVVREVVRGDAHPGDRISIQHDMSTRASDLAGREGTSLFYWKHTVACS